MNALELLKQQHDAVKGLFESYEEAENEDEKQTLFEEIADNLAAHSTIEEEIFYPAAYQGEAEPLLREAVEEHLSIKRLLADLLVMSAQDENFDAKVKVVQEQVEHHVQEEEGELFKKVTKMIDKDELERLGAEMQAMFDDLIEEGPSDRIPDEIGEAARLR